MSSRIPLFLFFIFATTACTNKKAQIVDELKKLDGKLAHYTVMQEIVKKDLNKVRLSFLDSSINIKKGIEPKEIDYKIYMDSISTYQDSEYMVKKIIDSLNYELKKY